MPFDGCLDVKTSLDSATESLLVMSNAFWFLATLDVLVSIGVEVWVWLVVTRGNTSGRSIALAISQRKDIWLVSAIVWSVLIGDRVSSSALLHAAGALAMVWLIWRTLRRLHLFARSG